MSIFLSTLLVPIVFMGIDNHTDSIFNSEFFSIQLLDRNTKEFLQYSDEKFGFAKLVECKNGKDDEPRIQVDNCESDTSWDELYQRLIPNKVIWFQFQFPTHNSGSTNYTQAEIMNGYRLIQGPKKTKRRFKMSYNHRLETQVVMFDEEPAKNPNVDGYAFYHLADMKKLLDRLESQKVMGCYDAFYLRKIPLDQIEQHFANISVLVYLMENQITPNMTELGIRLLHIRKYAKSVLLLLDPKLAIPAETKFPNVNWEMIPTKYQTSFPDHKTFLTLANSKRRFAYFDVTSCGKTRVVLRDCKGPLVTLDNLMSVTDNSMTWMLTGTDVSKMNYIGKYRIKPFALIKALIGPNSYPSIEPIPDLPDLPDFPEKSKLFRFLFGYKEKTGVEKSYTSEQIGQLKPLIRHAPSGALFRVDFLAHPDLWILFEPILKDPNFRWMVLYDNFYLEGREKVKLNDQQIKDLRDNLGNITTPEVLLFVDDELRERLREIDPDKRPPTTTTLATTTTEKTTIPPSTSTTTPSTTTASGAATNELQRILIFVMVLILVIIIIF